MWKRSSQLRALLQLSQLLSPYMVIIVAFKPGCVGPRAMSRVAGNHWEAVVFSVRMAAQQIIDRSLGACPGVDLLHDHRTVQRMAAVLRRQLPGHDDAPRRHAAVAHLAGAAIVDPGRLT